jgi:signal recognition particle receptor subunit beta
MKSPRQVRSDIRTLTTHIGHIRDALHKKADVTIAQVGKECKRTSDVLAELLKSQELPENYKVAVVGRFKTGKSSFVNELLGARLASEDTNPETAAITTFRHGPVVKATVRFVSQEKWTKLKALYAEDPKHIDAHRVRMWSSFGKPRKSKDGDEDSFDLPALERQFLKASGHSLEIALATDGTKKAETEFRRKLKEFTSGAKPHHCLVESIDIESPAPILDEGVLLIDTPGLDDTERFRVSLTEETVKDVDAILFLTKSGESYSQSDKDFLLSLLRKGTVKQLIVVITQVDVTYQQHLDNAEANDEDPEPLSLRIERERRRLAKELAATLVELSHDDSPAMRRYREQLGDVEVAFTSTKLHRNGKEGKPNPCAIDPADPGGVERLKSQLLRLLSSESRLAVAAQHIALGARTSLLDLQTVLDTKLLAIRDIKDREVAEQKLRNFRHEFRAASQRFEGAVKKQVELLGERLVERRQQHGILLENITLLAERELAAFETNDVARHWRTRRSGYWGYMHDLQGRTANRIFPKVQQMLGEYTLHFAEFARNFEVYLDVLAKDGSKISESLELGTSLPFDVTTKLKESLERSLQRAQDLIAAEEQRVTSLLDDFVTDEVSERIDAVRSKVSDIWGAGTTRSQSAEIQGFYREVKQLLSTALIEHLQERGQTFGSFLMEEAKTSPRDALDEVQVLLEQAADNIRAAAEALVAGQKEAIEKLVADIKAEHQDVLHRADLLLQAETAPLESASKVGDLPEHMPAPPQVPAVTTSETAITAISVAAEQSVADGVGAAKQVNTNYTPTTSAVADVDWADAIQQEATVSVDRLRLREDATGWSFDKVFPIHYIKGAMRVQLIDPYLAKYHQTRNLIELLLHLAESARPKDIEVVTAYAPDELVDRQEQLLKNAASDLFKNYGVNLVVRRDTGLHDRYLVLDHGVLFKLGRGLDIYKPAVGLGVHRSANRRVRENAVDVFATPDHALTST